MFAVDVEASAETPVVMASLAASSGTKTALPGGPAVGVDCMRLDRDVRELKDLDEVLVTQVRSALSCAVHYRICWGRPS